MVFHHLLFIQTSGINWTLINFIMSNAAKSEKDFTVVG